MKKLIIYLDESKIKSVHSDDHDIQVILMDADSNYVDEEQLKDMHKKEIKGMVAMPIKEVKIT